MALAESQVLPEPPSPKTFKESSTFQAHRRHPRVIGYSPHRSRHMGAMTIPVLNISIVINEVIGIVEIKVVPEIGVIRVNT